MDGQERLFRLAHEAVSVSAHFIKGEGWSVRICMRRGDETWEQARRSDYSHLNTEELVTVIDTELEYGLGLQ